MTNIIQSQFPPKYDVYIQGFGGGASLLFAKHYDKVQIYNDLNKNVYSLFYVLKDKQLFQQFKYKLDLTYYSKQLIIQFQYWIELIIIFMLTEQVLTLLEVFQHVYYQEEI